jgi:hypothetical protein
MVIAEARLDMITPPALVLSGEAARVSLGEGR